MSQQAMQGSGWTKTDGTATPVVSPVSSASSDKTLIWPTGAIALFVNLPSAAGSLKDGSGTAVMTIPAATLFRVYGKPGDSTQIGRGATTIEFVFVLG